MPTYEYRCTGGHDFERFQRMSDEPVSTCPECGEKAERVLSGGGGFLFKGSGFYITDYRSDGYRAAKKAETKSTSGSDSGGGEKSAKSSSTSTPATD